MGISLPGFLFPIFKLSGDLSEEHLASSIVLFFENFREERPVAPADPFYHHAPNLNRKLHLIPHPLSVEQTQVSATFENLTKSSYL